MCQPEALDVGRLLLLFTPGTLLLNLICSWGTGKGGSGG